MSASPETEAPRRLLHVYPSFAIGGAQVRFAAIANHFGRRWRHEIIAMDGNLACAERLSPELDIGFPKVEIRKGDMPGNIARFRRLLATMRPHALVTSNWGSIEWAMANATLWPGVRQLHIEDGFGPEERNHQLRRRVLTRRLILRRCSVVLPSRVLWRLATGQWGLDPARVFYIPNGIDLDGFAAQAEVSVPGEDPVIGTVAALRAEKNTARLLHALRILRETMPARLVVVGDGPEREGLAALAQSLGVAEAVHFAGHVAAPQLLYRGFAVFALSSDTEQMPMTVLEAMAAGLPVAATDVGDIREMVAPENANFIVPLDPGALAGALRRLLANPTAARALGAANRRRAERDFNQERMFRAYAELYDGPAAPRGGHGPAGVGSRFRGRASCAGQLRRGP